LLIRRIIQINKLVSLVNALSILADLTDHIMGEVIEEPVILGIQPVYIDIVNCPYIQLGEPMHVLGGLSI
jgi:hypothetical protein